MLHVRVLTPSPRAPQVLDVLSGEPGATHVVHLPGAALEPPGDVVMADVAREAVPGLIDRLRELGVEGDGAICLENLDAVLGESADEAERRAPGEGVDALVWEELRDHTHEDATLSGSYAVFFVVATLLAAIGLLIDSQVAIVGAMVLGPEFGPLVHLAVALVSRDGGAARLALRSLAVGFGLAIVATALVVVALHAAGVVPPEYLQGRRPMTAFVASPDVFSVLVALLAGVAGTVSLTASKSGPLVGVFISVTTVPAAAEIAASAVTGQFAATRGAALQLGINLVCIILAASLTLRVQRAAGRSQTARSRSRGAPATRAPRGSDQVRSG